VEGRRHRDSKPGNEQQCPGPALQGGARWSHDGGQSGAPEESTELGSAGCQSDILYLSEKYPQAMNACIEALELNPLNALAWNTKGNVLYKLKRYTRL